MTKTILLGLALATAVIVAASRLAERPTLPDTTACLGPTADGGEALQLKAALDAAQGRLPPGRRPPWPTPADPGDIAVVRLLEGFQTVTV
jgi:hypothetical protein